MRVLGLMLVFLLTASCGGISNKLCGAPGQPCCSSNACDVGAVCSDSVCEVCGGENQRCCSDGCGSSLVCSAGVCSAGLSCMTSCTLGSSRCANNGIETCTAAGVCPVWTSTVAACPAGTLCVADAVSADCVETCPGACSPDVVVCNNEGLRLCVASSPCPILEGRMDNVDFPQCITGAIVTPELSWESPTAFGETVVDIAGELTASYWVLDNLGNVVRYYYGSWTYELRPALGHRMKHLASCGQGSIVFAAGEGGTVFRHGASAWTEESVGSATDLIDVDCDGRRVYAIGANGKLYIRSTTGGSGTWSEWNTGFAQSFNAIGVLFSTSQAFLGGAAGLIVKCETTTLPPTCTNDSSGAVSNINAFATDPFSSTVWAVGDNGTLLERGATWSAGTMVGTTDDIVGIDVLPSAASADVVAVTRSGTVLYREALLPRKTFQIPQVRLTSVWLPDTTTLLVGADNGGLFFHDGLDNPAPFVARGGRKPLSQSLAAVASVGNGRLFAVGENGARVKRQNGAWSVDEVGVSVTQSLNAIAVRNAGEIYAVGNAGTVVIRRFGSWVTDAVGVTNQSLQAVAVDTKHVWALGQSVLLEKDLTTGVWRTVPLPASLTFGTLALRKDANGAALELFIGGERCQNWTFGLTDGVFTPGPSCNAANDFTASAYMASGDLMAATQSGHILRRTGPTWSDEIVNGSTLEPFWGLVPDGSSMWAVGTFGRVYRRLTTNWSEAAADVTLGEFRAGVKDEEGLFLVGTGGMVLRRQ